MCCGSNCKGWLFLFEQTTAYTVRMSDWGADVCSSDLRVAKARAIGNQAITDVVEELVADDQFIQRAVIVDRQIALEVHGDRTVVQRSLRSEEHTSELQSLMRNSYAVFCLKKKKLETNTVVIELHIEHYQYRLKIE